MKPLLLAVAALVAGGPLAARADDVLPTPPPPSRYDKLAQHSPFSPPTAPVLVAPTPPPPKPPGWADALSIASAMQNGANYLITIVDRDSNNERFMASSDGSVKNSRDVTVASVQWSEIINQTQATLRKGTETAVVKFDAAGLPPPPSQPGPPIPGAAFRSAPVNRPTPVPAANANVAAQNALRRNQIIRSPPANLPTPQRPTSTQARPAPLPDEDDDDE